MATLILRPTSTVASGNWTGGYADVDEVSSDEDGSYAKYSTTKENDDRQFYIRENGVYTKIGSGAPFTDVYDTDTLTLTTTPSSGVYNFPFTVADIDALAAGEAGLTRMGIPAGILFGFPACGIIGTINSVKLFRRDKRVYTGYPDCDIRLTQFYVEIDYTPAPTVETIAANNVEEITGNPRGNVTDIGTQNPSRYIDYDTDSGEPYANTKDCGVGGVGEYNSNLTGLSPGQKYYYRARVVNPTGETTGSEMTFTTKPNPPTAFSATPVSPTQINVGWTKGTGAEKTMVRRKVGSYPTSVSDGDQAYFDTGNSFNDTGREPRKHYFYRAWSYKTGAPNAGYSDEYAEDDGKTATPSSFSCFVG